MKSPTFDSDGYPTTETLNAITKWEYDEDFKELIRYVQKAWKWGENYFIVTENDDKLEVEVHTGGWSGNEELIMALKDNTLFYFMCWQDSEGTGRYGFLV